jgi:hypothetical protein
MTVFALIALVCGSIAQTGAKQCYASMSQCVYLKTNMTPDQAVLNCIFEVGR